MAAMIKTNGNTQSWLSGLVQWIKSFISRQREEMAARAASPALTGINLTQQDYTPAKLTEHPGVGSHEEIEPMK
jgi:hypothetical protein